MVQSSYPYMRGGDSMSTDQDNQRKMEITDSIPEAEWCEARVLYIKEGRTVQEIAKAFCCDKRTASRMVRDNWSPDDIGKKRTPNKVDEFKDTIELLLKSARFRGMWQITVVASALLEELRPHGYSGSAKTIERYLRMVVWKEWVTPDE